MLFIYGTSHYSVGVRDRGTVTTKLRNRYLRSFSGTEKEGKMSEKGMFSGNWKSETVLFGQGRES